MGRKMKFNKSIISNLKGWEKRYIASTDKYNIDKDKTKRGDYEIQSRR
jgi:hypothetical protein